VPITFTVDHARRLVEVKAEGVVDLKDVEAFLDAIVVQDLLPYRKLFNGRTATAKYVEADVMMLGARISAYAANMGPRGAVAFISGSKEAFELASRFINLGKSGRPAKAFMSETEARKWLEEQIES
jgi:hypothetical protein